MINKDDLSNEIKFFECLDGARAAFGKFAYGQARSFYDAVKKSGRPQQIKSVTGSNVLLAKTLISLSLPRRIMVMQLREGAEFIKFDRINTDPRFEKLKTELFADEPNLSNAECEKILRQVCNSIAHGDIIKSFDFKVFEDGIYEIYKTCGTIESKKNFDLQKKLEDTIRNSCLIKVNYESNFIFNADGTRTKRPHPVKLELKFVWSHLVTLMDLLTEEGFTKTDPTALNFLDKNGLIEKTSLNTGTTQIQLTPKQLEALKELTLDFKQMMFELDGKTISKEDEDIFTPKNELDVLILRAALQNVLIGKDYTYLKTRNFFDAGISIPGNIESAKRDFAQYQNDVSNLDIKLYPNRGELYRALYQNFKMDRSYKEILSTEVLNMLELAEQNNLLTKIARKCDFLTDLVCEEKEIGEEEVTDRDLLTAISHIRNSFMHGLYINNVDDKFEIFDYTTRTDKTPDFKFTVYNEDLEDIAQKSLEVFKDLKRELTESEERSL